MATSATMSTNHSVTIQTTHTIQTRETTTITEVTISHSSVIHTSDTPAGSNQLTSVMISGIITFLLVCLVAFTVILFVVCMIMKRRNRKRKWQLTMAEIPKNPLNSIPSSCK